MLTKLERKIQKLFKGYDYTIVLYGVILTKKFTKNIDKKIIIDKLCGSITSLYEDKTSNDYGLNPLSFDDIKNLSTIIKLMKEEED